MTRTFGLPWPEKGRDMSNKTQLQENNQELQSILNEIQGLPGGQQGAYVWKKLTAEGGDFVDFVVNDTETAYPDGGMQDGYWYEKFNPATLIANNVRKDVDIWGVIGTLVEGVTGIDYGTVNFSSDAYNPDELTFSHNLGVVPSHVIVVASSFIIDNFCASFDEDGVGMHRSAQSGDVSINMSVNKTAKNVTVTVGQSYLWSFPVARAIYWFAIA